mmetsp:Transcript_8508/g.14689  ORF Transcript_8508/g.14689 Transcript_8508/m.14689 type:complete len:107 (+) Transcript_8508:89-409(+)
MSAKCAKCGKTAYAAEQQRYDDNVYHRLCLIKKRQEMKNENPEYPQNRPQGAKVDVAINPSNPTQTVVSSGKSNSNSSSGGGSNFCSGCGKKRGDGNFCSGCGKKF